MANQQSQTPAKATNTVASNKPVTAPTAPKVEKELTAEEIAALKVARFKKVASGRSSAILKNLSLLENCANKSAYTYTNEQVEKMITAIKKAVIKMEEKFNETVKEKTDTRISL